MTSAINLNQAPLLEESDNESVWDTGEATLLFDLNQEPCLEEEYHEQDSEHQTGTNAPHQPEAEHQTGTNAHHQPKQIRLSNGDRLQILHKLLHRAKEGQLPVRAINDIAHELSLSRRTIGRIWRTTRQQQTANQRYNVSTKYHNCGRKRIEIQPEAITSLTMGDRSCLRDLASKLSLSKTTVHRMVKREIIKPHTNPLHPGLKASHKITRLDWILKLLQGDTPETKSEYFLMFDFLHLDEKWFYQSKKSHRVYLEQSERGQYRFASSIPKIMFIAVVARPRFNLEGQCTFDGKIGIFPFTYQEAAKRKSKNREKGTVVTKVVESVNKNVTRSMLINDILPAIKAKWPQDGAQRVIFIQQDNAKAHITQDDAEWQKVYCQDGFTFILLQQPTNSHDLNILDLGFFRSIQSLMHKKMLKNVDHMLDAVKDAFYELSPTTLSDVWMTLQYVMNEILKAKGTNDYDLPHHNKKKLAARGNLPTQVHAPMWAVIQAWDIVQGEYKH